MQNVRRARDDASTGSRALRRRQQARPATDACPTRPELERELYVLGALIALIAAGGDVDGRER